MKMILKSQVAQKLGILGHGVEPRGPLVPSPIFVSCIVKHVVRKKIKSTFEWWDQRCRAAIVQRKRIVFLSNVECITLAFIFSVNQSCLHDLVSVRLQLGNEINNPSPPCLSCLLSQSVSGLLGLFLWTVNTKLFCRKQS